MRTTRLGFTFVEVSISLLIGITIIGVAIVFFQHTTEMGDKARDIATATQAAAQFYYALEQDVANMVPTKRPEDCFHVEDGDVGTGGTPGLRFFEFHRMEPAKELQLAWDSLDYMQRGNSVKVRYEAKKGDSALTKDVFVLTRKEWQDDGTTKDTIFRGGFASDVRFSRVKMPLSLTSPNPSDVSWFLRVTLVLVGEALVKDAKSVRKAPPVTLSTLYRMTVDNVDPSKPLRVAGEP